MSKGEIITKKDAARIAWSRRLMLAVPVLIVSVLTPASANAWWSGKNFFAPANTTTTVQMGTSYIQGTVRQVSDGSGCTPYTSNLRMYRLMLPTISLVYNNNSHGGCSAISNSKTYGSLDSNRIYDNFRPTNDINGDVEAWDSNG